MVYGINLRALKTKNKVIGEKKLKTVESLIHFILLVFLILAALIRLEVSFQNFRRNNISMSKNSHSERFALIWLLIQRFWFCIVNKSYSIAKNYSLTLFYSECTFLSSVISQTLFHQHFCPSRYSDFLVGVVWKCHII